MVGASLTRLSELVLSDFFSFSFSFNVLANNSDAAGFAPTVTRLHAHASRNILGYECMILHASLTLLHELNSYRHFVCDRNSCGIGRRYCCRLR